MTEPNALKQDTTKQTTARPPTTRQDAIKQYAIVTGNYWGFTLTDGALRMLIVLHFHQLGYGPLAIAMLFLFYEFFGVVTNLLGGWLGARIGLNRTMNIGLGLQLVALAMLLVPSDWLLSSFGVPWVMAAQALSGIAKDLNKMSAKSAIKQLIPGDAQGRLFAWIAFLTGSKNALKGVGFFLGGALLAGFEFQGTVLILLCCLGAVWIASLLLLKEELGKAKHKPKFREIFSKSGPVNKLSAARLFLFGARDVWFVVALPVYFSQQLNWSHSQVGGFFALWIIAYGAVQAFAPYLTGKKQGKMPDGTTIAGWGFALTLLPALLVWMPWQAQPMWLVAGLFCFGGLFAINSSLHSYMIVRYASADGTSLDVGFYYMSNALGRLIGTLLSGWLFQSYGLAVCLMVSTAMLLLASVIALGLPREAKH